MRSTEGGYVAIFAIIFFGLCAAGIILIFIAYSGVTTGRLVWFGATAVLSSLMLIFEWRRDRYAVHVFGAGMLGMGAVITATTTFSLYSLDSRLSLGWLTTALAFSAAAVAQTVFLYRLKHGPEDPRFPNVLRHEYGDKAILERDGIQVVTGLLSGGGPALVLLLQNCWLANRTVRLKLDTGNIHVGTTDPRLFVDTLEVGLGPAEVAKVVIPVRPIGKAFSVFVDLSVAGGGGKRARMWEGRSIQARVSPGRSILALAAGVLIWGGGIKFSIPASSPIEGDRSPEVTTEWRPSAGDVPIEPT
jgi:hypothetical protein